MPKTGSEEHNPPQQELSYVQLSIYQYIWPRHQQIKPQASRQATARTICLPLLNILQHIALTLKRF